MDARRGGWGQLLALFRMIHKGHRSHFVQASGGSHRKRSADDSDERSDI